MNLVTSSTRRVAIQLTRGRPVSARSVGTFSLLMPDAVDITHTGAPKCEIDRHIVTRYRYVHTTSSEKQKATNPVPSNTTTTTSPFFLDTGCEMIPHPEKIHKGGEDAFFTHDGSMGVADGVSSWAHHGIDPKLFSLGLMNHCKQACENGLKDPISILEEAYNKVQGILGSSTACVGVLIDDKFDALNLGDSGFMIIRGNDIIHRSQEQVHSFNCPFQLGTNSRDKPKHGLRTQTKVMDGDIIIMASDGLFDNLFDIDIVALVEKTLASYGPSCTPQQIARSLANAAMEKAKSPSGWTPFAENAQENGYRFSGGKLDDVTVVVARVSTATMQ